MTDKDITLTASDADTISMLLGHAVDYFNQQAVNMEDEDAAVAESYRDLAEMAQHYQDKMMRSR
jgi:hypothetical protein